MGLTSTEIEDEIERLAGVHAIVELSEHQVILTGMVETNGERQAAIDIVTELLPEHQVVDDLEVVSVLPDKLPGLDIEEAPAGPWPAATPQTEDDESLEPGDFTDQEVLANPYGAAGPHGVAIDEEISEGDEAYVPPIDPVFSPEGGVIGAFALSSEPVEVARSALDNDLGDEAIADAVRLELLEDAATTDLTLEVEVENGIVTLRGLVQTLDDAENAEAIAARVPGVLDVVDEMTVANL